MKEAFKLRSGKITNPECSTQFHCGIVFVDDGVYYFDLYGSDYSFVDLFISKTGLLHIYTLSDTYSVDDCSIEANDLEILNINARQSLIRLRSLDYIKYSNIIASDDQKCSKKLISSLEVEGLEVLLNKLTVRHNGIIDNSRDITSFEFTFNSTIRADIVNIEMSLQVNADRTGATIRFNDTANKCLLDYDIYKEFKSELVSFLSLLNTGRVEIRSETTHELNIALEIIAITDISYSFKKLKHSSSYKYIPVNDTVCIDNKIIQHTFINCFQIFINQYKKYDLSSLIYYINNSLTISSIEERFYVLIIAFERIAYLHMKSTDKKDLLIVCDEKYNHIKERFIDILNGYRVDFPEDKIECLIRKVNDLHRIKSNDNKYKFKRLLEDFEIVVNKDIKSLFGNIRNSAVHEGKFGEADEGYKNYLILDELLRDIILNMIGYKSIRVSRYRGSLL
jgi:hypothetical protein